ncbi:MAG: hypothetical protein LBT00_02470 [Spirochaetaceae bacterium]|nr:hypothetical protein [Spirochaetaceae bacterium]
MRGPLQPSASCFGLPGRGAWRASSLRGGGNTVANSDEAIQPTGVLHWIASPLRGSQ